MRRTRVSTPVSRAKTTAAAAASPEVAFGARLTRRHLLVWSGAAALLPACEGIARAQEAAGAARLAPQPMSIGYVDGSDAWRTFRSITSATLQRGIRVERGRPPEPATVVPATSLLTGDQELANELVSVHVHGLYPIPNPTHVRSAYFTVLFPSTDPAFKPAPLPFLAWGYKSQPAPDVPAPVRFVAPLGPTGDLDLLFEVDPAPNRKLARRPVVSPAPSPVGGRFTASFTVDWFAGRPRLQRGLYLLGMAPDTWAVERTLPTASPGVSRPVELISLMISIEPLPPQ